VPTRVKRDQDCLGRGELKPVLLGWTSSSLSERCSLAPCGRLMSGEIAQKQTKNGHEALYYRVLRQAASSAHVERDQWLSGWSQKQLT